MVLSAADAATKDAPSLVVGVGASAGGLEAFRKLLDVLPARSGMAFILVQHLDPQHDSLLTELLARHTAMNLVKAADGSRVEPDTIYVIAPGTFLGVKDGRLEVTQPSLERGMRLPVNHLFRSLAKQYGSSAVGVVLSGAGSDGTAGLIDIRAAGGLSLVQDPDTAAHTGMPKSAADAGAVDLVVGLDEIPDALERFASISPSARATPLEHPDLEAEFPPPLGYEELSELKKLLMQEANFNLGAYKSGTVERRIFRRMALAGFESLKTYLAELRADPEELKALLRDLLINFTSFFRDPAAYEALRTLVIDPLVKEATPGETLRVWVAGCATGQEAYSLAMEFFDAIESHERPLSLRIFATDADDKALEVARSGLYPPGSVAALPGDRVQKFFEPVTDLGYQIQSFVRDAVSFALHDVNRDPPFSRMHLVSCRNLLIYLRPEAQQRVLRALHFALKPNCYLFLGTSESTREHREDFATLSKKWRIYRKVGDSRMPYLPGRCRGSVPPIIRTALPPATNVNESNRSETASQDLLRRAVLRARVPPTIVVGPDGRVLFMHGELRPFLRFPEGSPQLELADLLTPELATRTRAALYKSRRDGLTVVAESSPDASPGGRTTITASLCEELGDGAVIITFERSAPDDEEKRVESRWPASGGETVDAQQRTVIEQLERELHATRDDLHNTVEELESSNEELRSAHEEAVSMNEELQSSNEELEATTEELRSLNEELTTVNAQLRDKVAELEITHDDLSNFFASTKIATLFLDEGLHIKRMTPEAENLLSVSENDLGRFVGDFNRNLLQNDLVAQSHEVLEDFAATSHDIRTSDGRWITRNVLPYKTENRRVEGVVVTFVDVTDLKRVTERVGAREGQQAVIARLGLRALENRNLQALLDTAVLEVQQTLGTDFCEVLEVQPGGQTLLLRAGAGWAEGSVGETVVDAGLTTHAGFTINSGAPVLADDIPNDRRFGGTQLLEEHDVTSGVSCVIGGPQAPYGVLSAFSKTGRKFTAEDSNFLQSAATVIAAGVNRYQSHARNLLERATAQALAEADSVETVVSTLHFAVAREIDVCLTELWEITDDGSALERRSTLTVTPEDEEQLRDMLAPDRFPIASGGIGEVARERSARWFSSLEQPARFPRSEVARRLGLSGGLALPIVHGGETTGVIAFFSRSRLTADETFLASLEATGRAIGDFAHGMQVERRFRMTVDNAPVGIGDRSMDGRWLRVNDRLCEITGYSRDEMLEPEFPDIAHPDDGDRDELFARLRHSEAGSFSREKRYIRKDGSHVWVNVSLSTVAQPGGPEYCIAVVEDISRRKAVEAELRDSESRFRRVLISSPVPMMLYDGDGEIVELNKAWAALAGYSIDELSDVGDWIEKAHPNGGQDISELYLEREPVGDLSAGYEVELTTRSGATRTVLLTCATLGASSTGAPMRIAAAADITQQRRFEHELIEASNQKDDFIAMLSHELRNPLAAVRTAAEILQRTRPEDAEVQRTRAVIQRQSSHMAHLLDGLLDVSRIIRGKIELDRRVVDLNETLRKVAEDVEPRFKASKLTFELLLPEQPAWAECDTVRITQVLDNLLSNAIKYTAPPGTVKLALEHRSGDVVITVRDTGEGIDPELLPNLFQTFQQGEQSLDRAKGGLGLGLALVKTLVELHGGDVEAHSDGPGRGAEFVVRLPMTAAPADREDDGPASARPRRIVLIEDNEDAAMLLKELLELDGHDVSVAHRGTDGIELARTTDPDVVLCDIGLPDGISGFDVAEALRESGGEQLFLVALTGYGRSQDRKRSFEAGFDAHLTKPVSPEELDGVLQRAGSRRSSDD